MLTPAKPQGKLSLASGTEMRGRGPERILVLVRAEVHQQERRDVPEL